MNRRYEMVLFTYGEAEDRRAERQIRHSVSAPTEEEARRKAVEHARRQDSYVSRFLSIAVKDLA